jgi:hypothetical protein
MDRRRFLLVTGLFSGVEILAGCRSNQFATVRAPDKPDMVGSHAAGAETYKPLVQQAVGQLLARHSQSPEVIQTSATNLPTPPQRICFVAVENKSAEEIGDFKEQIYQVIDTQLLESKVFQPVNKRFVDAGLSEARLRPDQLFVPENMRIFVAIMEQQGQPFDALLYATITSGTTRENKDYQRDYLLTLELIDISSGMHDKESATLSKGYYHSRMAKWLSFTKLKR